MQMHQLRGEERNWQWSRLRTMVGILREAVPGRHFVRW